MSHGCTVAHCPMFILMSNKYTLSWWMLVCVKIMNHICHGFHGSVGGYIGTICFLNLKLICTRCVCCRPSHSLVRLQILIPLHPVNHLTAFSSVKEKRYHLNKINCRFFLDFHPEPTFHILPYSFASVPPFYNNKILPKKPMKLIYKLKT
jgi:hypothetical protein